MPSFLLSVDERKAQVQEFRVGPRDLHRCWSGQAPTTESDLPCSRMLAETAVEDSPSVRSGFGAPEAIYRPCWLFLRHPRATH